MRKVTKKKKNEKGEGTFRKITNGTYEYRIVFIDTDGITKRKSFYGQSDVVCKDKAEAFIDQLEKKKLGVFVEATIPDLVRAKYEIDLANNYVHEQGYSRNMYTISIIENSAIGDVPISALTESHIELFLRSLTHYSNSVIVKVYRQVRLGFKEAYEKKIIDYDFMASGKIRCPKSNKKDKKITSLSQSEQQRFVDFLENYSAPKNRNVYTRQLLISLYTGMRMGEVNALKCENIDFKNNVIHVCSTVSRGTDDRSFIKDGTKTDAGIRDIPIMDSLKPILKEAIENSSEKGHGLLFYDDEHDKIITTSQVNCFFHRVCEKCDISVGGQHSLRHTFATRCIEADVPPVVLKNWLGHTDIHITLDTYADVFSNMHNDSITKLDTYINGLSKVS